MHIINDLFDALKLFLIILFIISGVQLLLIGDPKYFMLAILLATSIRWIEIK